MYNYIWIVKTTMLLLKVNPVTKMIAQFSSLCLLDSLDTSFFINMQSLLTEKKTLIFHNGVHSFSFKNLYLTVYDALPLPVYSKKIDTKKSIENLIIFYFILKVFHPPPLPAAFVVILCLFLCLQSPPPPHLSLTLLNPAILLSIYGIPCIP